MRRSLQDREGARARALGRDEEAVALAIEPADALTESRPEQAGRAYAIAADVYARNGDAAQALELYERAAELAERHPEFVREVYAKMAELLEQDGPQGRGARAAQARRGAKQSESARARQ